MWDLSLSLSLYSASLSLSDLNKQPSKEEASSKPANIQDGSKAKFRVTAKVVPKCKLCKVYGFITTLQLQGNTERNMRQSEMTTKLKVQPHIFNLRLYKFSVS